MCAPAKGDKKEAEENKENDAPADETVMEPVEVAAGEPSTSDAMPIDVKKISTEHKTVG